VNIIKQFDNSQMYENISRMILVQAYHPVTQIDSGTLPDRTAAKLVNMTKHTNSARSRSGNAPFHSITSLARSRVAIDQLDTDIVMRGQARTARRY